MTSLDERGEKIANCPTPYYHDTHRYCPSCPWTEEDSMTDKERAHKRAERIRDTCADLHGQGHDVPIELLEPILRFADEVDRG